MSDLERYLNRATRGLWGRRRRATRDELASHIFERGRQHMAGGQTEAEAQRTVLRELGAPALVSRELARVHTLPLAAPALALALLASGVGILATRAAAQVRVPVFEQKETPNPGGVYVALNSLKLAFLTAGVKMTGPDETPTLSAKGLPTVTLKLGRLDKTRYDAVQAGDLWEPLVYPISQTTRYINLTALAAAAVRQGWPVTVSGWNQPVLTIGPAKFALNGARTAANLYFDEAWVRLIEETAALEQQGQPIGPSRFATMTVAQAYADRLSDHRIAARAQPGRMYALATPYAAPPTTDGQRYDTYMIAVAQAAEDGSLTFALPLSVSHLRSVATLTDTTADFKRLGSGQLTYSRPQIRGAAFIYALSGNIPGSNSRLNILRFTGISDGR